MAPSTGKQAWISFNGRRRYPVLLINGDDNRNVPFSETVRKAGRLRKNNGGPVSKAKGLRFKTSDNIPACEAF